LFANNLNLLPKRIREAVKGLIFLLFKTNSIDCSKKSDDIWRGLFLRVISTAEPIFVLAQKITAKKVG
jgi:hypothetical protein